MEKFLLSLLCLLTVGFAGQADLTYDVSKNTSTWMPQGSNASEIEKTAPDGQTFKFGKDTYYNTGYLFIKKDGFVATMPSVKCNKIILHTTSGQGASCSVNVFVGSTAISTAVTLEKNKDHEFIIPTDYQTGMIEFSIKNVSSKNAQITQITFVGENIEPSLPTECAEPVFTIDGVKAVGEDLTAYAGSKIAVSCATKDSKTVWSVAKGSDENGTIIEGAEYVIPADAEIGDIYTFAATASVQTEDGKSEKSTFITVTIADKKGTLSNPYSVQDIRNASSANLGNGIWVKGFIIGDVNNSKLRLTGCGNTNLALSDVKDGHKANDSFDANGGFIPVELPKDTKIREGLNLQDHSDFIGHEVLIYANNEKYFSKSALKGTSAYIFLSKSPEIPTIEDQDGIDHVSNQIKITDLMNIKINVSEAVDIWYKLENNNENNIENMTRAESSEHSHGDFVKYDATKGIDINNSNTAISFYSCNPITKLHSSDIPISYEILSKESGVAEIEAAEAGEVRWFDMQGREVKGQPAAGVYVRVANGKAAKVIVK